MFLLDTNVVSELRKVRIGNANKHVKRWADNVPAEELYLSVVSIIELETGVLLAERRDKPNGVVLRTWLNDHVLKVFHERIINIDTSIALRFALLNLPNPIHIGDALIAATALVHNMTVVTRNTSDFERTGVPLLNPWMPIV